VVDAPLLRRLVVHGAVRVSLSNSVTGVVSMSCADTGVLRDSFQARLRSLTLMSSCLVLCLLFLLLFRLVRTPLILFSLSSSFCFQIVLAPVTNSCITCLILRLHWLGNVNLVAAFGALGILGVIIDSRSRGKIPSQTCSPPTAFLAKSTMSSHTLWISCRLS
jgi:hypothetical protein